MMVVVGMIMFVAIVTYVIAARMIIAHARAMKMDREAHIAAHKTHCAVRRKEAAQRISSIIVRDGANRSDAKSSLDKNIPLTDIVESASSDACWHSSSSDGSCSGWSE